MNRPAILLVTTSFPEAADGSEAAGAFVGDLAEALSTRMQVRVVAPGRRASCPLEPAAPGARVWRYRAGSRPLSQLSTKSPVDLIRILRTLVSMRRQCAAATSDGRVAHTLALWVLPCGWMARWLWRSRGIPYSAWALGSDIWVLGRAPVTRGAVRSVALAADRCFADGLQLATDAGEITGREFEFLPSTRQRLQVTNDSPRTLPPYTLLFLGRWHANKGVDLLLEALLSLPDRSWQRIASVTIAGGGPLEEEVNLAVARLIAAGRPVRQLGFLSRVEAAREMSAADWVLIPSRIESIPVVLSDALKAGRPVVATAVGDMADIVGLGTPCGIVAPEPTVPAIRNAIMQAIDADPERYAEGAREKAARFDLELIADRIHQLADPKA